QRWTESEAREALAELEASGESVAGFARRKGVSAQRLAYWRKRLGQAVETRFVALELPTTASARIEIAAAGVVVRVREDLDVEHVARLVEAIGQRVGGAC